MRPVTPLSLYVVEIFNKSVKPSKSLNESRMYPQVTALIGELSNYLLY